MVKDGHVVMPMLGAFGDSIFGVATACAAGTNKISHAVGGKRVVVIRKIALVWTAAFYGAAFHATKSAIAHTAFGDSALMQTKLAGDTGLCPGRLFRKPMRFSGAVVNLFDFRPHFLKMGPDTICAEAYYSGDRWTAFAAMTARAHTNVVVFKESFSTAVHAPCLCLVLGLYPNFIAEAFRRKAAKQHLWFFQLWKPVKHHLFF